MVKIPIFDAFLNNEEEFEGISCISIVDEPAMEKNMLVFNKDKKPVLFSVQDEMQHKITSVVIRCNYPIYRIDPEGREYYIRFGREVIDQLAEKYSKDGLLNSVSVQHNGELLNDIVMTEMFIKDTEKGINPKGFEDIEDYSLFATFKINNEEVWNRIMEGEFGGLSMEVMLDVKPTEEYVEAEDDYWAEFLRWLCSDEEEEFGLKKKFKIEKSSVVSAIEKGNVILIDEGGDKAVKYYPHSVGKKDGKDIVVLYNPDTKKWSVKTLSSIEGIVGKDKVGGFDYGDPSYKTIIDDDSVTVSRSVVVSGDRFLDAIKNKTWVQISYDDEQPDPATGYRQCIVVAYGTTSAGNIAIRCYEQFGDTRTICPDYKIFLLKRIRNFKEMVGVAPWTDDILDGRYHDGADKNLSYPLIYAYTRGE